MQGVRQGLLSVLGTRSLGSWRYDRRECVLCGLTPETMWAMHRVGGMVLGAIESHEQLVIKHPKGAQHAVVLKTLKDLKIHHMEVPWHERIEQGADLIITGNLLHTKQGTGVI